MTQNDKYRLKNSHTNAR